MWLCLACKGCQQPNSGADPDTDILMLSGKNPAVVVGNAQPDLLEWVEARLVQEAGAGARLLVATEHEALGILQCLDRLGLK